MIGTEWTCRFLLCYFIYLWKAELLIISMPENPIQENKDTQDDVYEIVLFFTRIVGQSSGLLCDCLAQNGIYFFLQRKGIRMLIRDVIQDLKGSIRYEYIIVGNAPAEALTATVGLK